MKRRGGTFSPRQHWNQTQARLILAGMALLIVVGGGLVWLFYGRTAAIAAISCILGVSAVIGLIWLLLTLLERWVKEERP